MHEFMKKFWLFFSIRDENQSWKEFFAQWSMKRKVLYIIMVACFMVAITAMYV